MKKITILLTILLSITFFPFKDIIAETTTMNLNIIIDSSVENEVKVIIPDDSNYEIRQPEISVNTNFSNVKVEKDGEAISYELNNGVVTFVIDDYNCSYIITKVSDDGYKYNPPKTGIE